MKRLMLGTVCDAVNAGTWFGEALTLLLNLRRGEVGEFDTWRIRILMSQRSALGGGKENGMP